MQFTTDIGNSCVAANIDRHLAPLSTPLINGQTVTIITAPGARPNPAWLNFVVTGKARSNIRHFLKSQRRAESIAWGRQLLDNALESSHISWEKIPPEKQKIILDTYQCKTIDELDEEIGLGNQMAQLIARRAVHILAVSSEKELQEEVTHVVQPMAIKGTEGMVVNYAACCRPIPGDTIVGVIQAGEGIIVHVDNCHTFEKLHITPDRLIPMQWDPHVQGDFKVDISLELINQRGMLAQVAGNISSAEADIDNISVNEQADQLCTVNLTLTVQDRVHLAKVLRRLRSIKAIKKIIRPR